MEVQTVTKPFGVVLQAERPGADVRDLRVGELQDVARQHRLVVLRGFGHLDSDALSAWCRTWGPLLEWNFGTVLNLQVEPNPKNYLFTPGRVPFHWDGAFAQAVPHFQVFQCLQAPPQEAGGETLFCDTSLIWQHASADEQRLWQSIRFIYRTEKVAHYGGEIVAPLVAKHPLTGETVLRYAEPMQDENSLNPVFVEAQGCDGAPIMQELEELLYRPTFCYAHAWQAGDFVIADNHVLLHGRRAFSERVPRHIQRVHIL